EPAEVPPVHHRARRPRPHGGDDTVDDQLPDPQHRQRYERADRAQGEDGYGVAAMGLVDELQEGRDILQGLEPLGPARRLAVRAAARAPGARNDTVGG